MCRSFLLERINKRNKDDDDNIPLTNGTHVSYVCMGERVPIHFGLNYMQELV